MSGTATDLQEHTLSRLTALNETFDGHERRYFDAGRYDADGARPDRPSADHYMLPLAGLRTELLARGACAGATGEFIAFLREEGWHAERHVIAAADLGVLGYPHPNACFAEHVVARVEVLLGDWLVDWTAAQYGCTEFPALRRV